MPHNDQLLTKHLMTVLYDAMQVACHFVFNIDNNNYVLTFCPKKRAFSESTEIPAPGPDLSAPFFAAGWTKRENIY